MKLTSQTRLRKLEEKLNCSRAKRSLSISYTKNNRMIFINYISCTVNEYFNWNGSILVVPDNGRRGYMQNDFFLTSEYMRKQPQIAEILREIAKEENLELAVDTPYLTSDFDEE